MIAPQRHEVHQGHASESHVFAPVTPVRVTVRHRGKPPRSRIGGEMLSQASHDAAPLTRKHHGQDTSEYVPLSDIRNLVGVLEPEIEVEGWKYHVEDMALVKETEAFGFWIAAYRAGRSDALGRNPACGVFT